MIITTSLEAHEHQFVFEKRTLSLSFLSLSLSLSLFSLCLQFGMLYMPDNRLHLLLQQEPRGPSQTLPRRQAAAPSVSPALVFLNTKVNANGKSCV